MPVFVMLRPTCLVSSPISELLGELQAFAARLGVPPLLAGPNEPGLRIGLPPALASMEKYKKRFLAGFELPAVARAFHHATRFEPRELIALDQHLSEALPLPSFARSSQHVGRVQLKRLRPLKDQRLVQRYVTAVQQRRAQGWHMLVYGVTLAIYSLPLRQGLINYARHTLNGLIQSAAPRTALGGYDSQTLLAEFCCDLPQLVDTALKAESLSFQLA